MCGGGGRQKDGSGGGGGGRGRGDTVLCVGVGNGCCPGGMCTGIGAWPGIGGKCDIGATSTLAGVVAVTPMVYCSCMCPSDDVPTGTAGAGPNCNVDWCCMPSVARFCTDWLLPGPLYAAVLAPPLGVGRLDEEGVLRAESDGSWSVEKPPGPAGCLGFVARPCSPRLPAFRDGILLDAGPGAFCDATAKVERLVPGLNRGGGGRIVS